MKKVYSTNKSLIIGVCGGSGSGKTLFCENLIKAIGKDNCCYLPMDSYYKDESHLSMKERELLNYDHPQVMDFELYSDHILSLKKGIGIKKPKYDFNTHTRTNYEYVSPKNIIITEGNFLFYSNQEKTILDIKVFIDVEADVRFIRRLKRDISQRGRSVESVINQYLNDVKPMHELYIEKFKNHNDIKINGGGNNTHGINKVVNSISQLLT